MCICTYVLFRQYKLLYSWRFSRYSASFHWLVHGHMTSNNETVSRQMPWAGNIAKAMTSNKKQFTVIRATVHCWPQLHVMAGISARFSNFAFVLFCYITNHLMTGPLGNSEFCFPRISMKFSGNKIHCSPRDQSLSVYYWFCRNFFSYISYGRGGGMRESSLIMYNLSKCHYLFKYSLHGIDNTCNNTTITQ